MNVDFERQVVTNDNLPKLFSEWTQYLKITEPYALFDDMSNNDIKEQTFGEKIYQLDSLGFLTMGIKTSIKDNRLFLTSDFDNGTNISFGYVEMDDSIRKILKQDYDLSLVSSGGKYKQVVTSKEGTQSVKQFFEPITLKLLFKSQEKSTSEVSVSPQEIQRSVANGKKIADNAQALGGCLGTVGVIGGLGLLAFGHPLFATILFVLCLSGAVYSMTPH